MQELNTMFEETDVISRSITPEKLEKMSYVLKAISHPIRLAIIELLVERDSLCVKDLTTLINMEQSLVSHHLKKLKNELILSSSRSGQRVYYSLEMKSITKIFDCMKNCKFEI